MPTLRDIRRKIASIRSTQKITRTMKMIASSRLRRCHEELERTRPYASKIEELKERLLSSVRKNIHPIVMEREEQKNLLIFACASDRGLCGSFNANVNAAIDNLISQMKDQYEKIGLYVLGKKIRDYFAKKGVPIVKEWIELRRIEKEHIESMVQDFMSYYLTSEFDKIVAIYTFFRSPIRQEVRTEELIPIKTKRDEGPIDYLYEPKAEYVVERFIPEYLRTKVYHMILNSQTSEHASRMNAMDNATNNCGEMINLLTLLYNKKRQESITKEMLDIVGGAEAVKRTTF
ncbi:MAG: ATP synthase F1 subunit gamma [Desulfobacterota bacterium]|nr:ATP synthase F1 subunit gamma [Thermodesulfobacteriota bacterium]MDW8001599.1 ATP synthase F1 subunit gamma [Deltaproteobacteria bacterium]